MELQRLVLVGPFKLNPFLLVKRRENDVKTTWLFSFILSFLLVACPEATKSAPTFTISLQPPVLNLRVTDTGSVKIIVNRSGGFAEAIVVTLEGETTGLEVEGLTITENEGTFNFRVTDAAKVGSSFPVVKAVGGSISRSETLTLHIEKAVAKPTEITIKDNNGSRQVRQGFGEIILEILGSNFERVTALSVGDLTTDILEQTASRLELKVAVPHAAPVGAKNLVLSTEGGDISESGAVIVTPITAGPLGNDSTGVGTSDRPYRTLKHALTMVQSGDTVKLLNGVYNAASGEVWPQVAGANLTPGPNIPVGIRVEGEGVETVLEGPGVPTATVALAFAGNGAASNLTVKNFAAGVFITTGDITLSSVRSETNGLGLAVGGGKVIVNSSEFTANEVGILAVDDANLEVTGGSSHHNLEDGVRLGDGTPTLKAKDLAVHHNSNGILVAGGAKLTLENTTLYDNTERGLEANESADITLKGCEVYSNGAGGLLFGGASLQVRGTTIRDNPSFGAYIEGEPTKVDFGTFIEPGNNRLENNAKVEGGGTGGDQLLDVRSDQVTLGDIVFTISATTFNGEKPEPDVYPGNGIWPYLNAPYFSILGVNNVIQIY
jgi:parallel beta-helix repeat protein